MQGRLGNVQKSVMPVQNCFFANLKLFLFLPSSLPSRSSLLKLCIVVIQKFCYHGNVTSHSFFTQMAGSFARFLFKHLLDILRLKTKNLRKLVEINIFYVMFSVKRL